MFQKSGINQDSAEEIYNRSEMEGFILRVIQSIKKQRLLVRDIADRLDEVDTYADNVYRDWVVKKMASIDKAAASGVCDKRKEVQQICKDRGRA